MEQKYTAPVETVFALLTQGKWLEERSAAMGEESATCKAAKKAGGVTVTMKRRVTRELPPVLAKLMSPEADIELTEQWTPEGDGYSGTLAMTIVGKPVKITAQFALTPKGKGCVYKIEHQCKASIPFVGAQVEKFVLGQTEQGCLDELEYLAAYLKKHK